MSAQNADKMPPSFGTAALRYVAKGMKVFPVYHLTRNKETGDLECACMKWKRKQAKELYGTEPKPCDAPGKHGRVQSWKAQASNDPDQIERWCKKWPISNVGIVTGAESGVFVLDIDGEEGRLNLERLEAEHGSLPSTATARTGSGGMHYFFRHPSGLDLANSASKVAPKIDIRATGGFVVAAPSNHKSGGRWPLLGEHLLDIICSGNAEYFEWLIGWIAQLLQEPGNKLGTAVALRGEKGTGKTTVANPLAMILGRHFVQLSHPDSLTGRFNAHLECALLANVEEGFWAGDKEAEGVLKNLITSDKMLLERKGVDAFMVANHVRLLVTSNSDWVVPATQDERRFFVLDVSTVKAKNGDWFGAIDRELKDGGAEAFLHDMLRFDYSHLDLRNPPRTEALVDQMIKTLAPKLEWWHSVLAEGAFESARSSETSATHELENWLVEAFEIEKTVVHENFNDYVRGTHGKPWVPAQIGKFLREMVPDLRETRPARGGDRARRYLFPPLSVLRAKFQARFHIGFGEADDTDNVFLRAANQMHKEDVLRAILDPDRD